LSNQNKTTARKYFEDILQEQKQIQNAWDNIAAGFDEFATPFNTDLAEKALRLVGLQSNMRFLDVAAGSGALSIPAARLGAQVLATDISPAMVERLRGRADKEDLSNLEARVMDGHTLELEEASFDICGSQHGVSLFPDMLRGLHELVRVTKPGGRVLIVAVGPPTEVEFFSFFMGAMQATVPGFTGLPMKPPPLPFQVADPEKLRQQLADAGLSEIRLETANWKMKFQTGKHMWDFVTNSNPIGAGLVADPTEEQRAAVQQVLDEKLRQRSGNNGPAVLTNSVNIGIGTK
jgi:ubiquinone/menaquinone biosynthesis C-methylase UbiE